MDDLYLTLKISQVESGVYEWSLHHFAGGDPLDEGVESTVTDCLRVSASSVEPYVLIAVAYRGIILATYRRNWMLADPAKLADELMEKIAELLG